MSRRDVIVAGGGFAGIYAAWRLARDGASVTLVEADAGIGGNLRSRAWEGYELDNGSQTLDLRSRAEHDFYTDVLGEDLATFDEPCWASTVGECWTQGFERPDFASEPAGVAERALAELAAMEADAARSGRPDASTDASTSAATCGIDDTLSERRYLDWYREVHGPTLAAAIEPMVRKATGSDPWTLSARARDSLAMFSRPKLGGDADMVALKASAAFWDARVGVTLGCEDARFAGVDVRGRIGYPAAGALGRFCERASARLVELGVEILAGAPVERAGRLASGVSIEAGGHVRSADALLWTLPDFVLAGLLGVPDRTRELSMPVGTCFFAFEVHENEIAGPDYLTDYAPGRLPFRYNRLGVYGAQTRADGRTPVMAEVPCHPADIGATLGPASVEAAWRALLEAGYLRRGARRGRATAWGHPVAYALPRVGREAAERDLRAGLHERLPGAVPIGAGRRGRAAFVAHYESSLRGELADRLCAAAGVPARAATG